MTDKVTLSATVDPDTDATLELVAARSGRSKAELVAHVLRDFADADGRFISLVEEGIASWRAGDLVSREQVLEDVERLLGRT